MIPDVTDVFFNHLKIGNSGVVNDYLWFNSKGKFKVTFEPGIKFEKGEQINNRTIAFKAFGLKEIKLTRFEHLKMFLFGKL